MDSFHRLFLRLTLVQGVSLALVAGLMIQWLSWTDAAAPPQSPSSLVAADDMDRSRFPWLLSSAWEGGTVIVLGAWGLLAGVTGWMMMNEQRHQMQALLHHHEVKAPVFLHLVSDDESDSVVESPEIRWEDAASAPVADVPSFRLRLADGDRDSRADEDLSSSRPVPCYPRSRPGT